MVSLPKLSILVCSNKAPAVMDELLASIVGQRRIEDCELVFVDNGIGHERAAEISARLERFPFRTRYVFEPKPGVWAARKTSYENASGEWFLILDDDNTLGNEALANAFEFIERHPMVGGICTRVVAKWERKPPEWIESFGRFCLSYIVSGRYGPEPEEKVWLPGQIDAFGPPGGGMIIRRAAAAAFLESYGRIPESLRNSRLGSEDFALYAFVSSLGYSTSYVPSVTVFHHLPQSRTRLGYLTRLNLNMAYAYGKLEHSGRTLTIRNIAGTVYGFACKTLASQPFHPWILWLNIVRISGFCAGLLSEKLRS